MKSHNALDRRRFLSLTAGAVTLPLLTSSTRAQKAAPSERINVGIIGLGGRSQALLASFLRQADVQVVALCDVQREHWRDGEWGRGPARFGTEPARLQVERAYDGKAKGLGIYQDFRNLIDHKGLDAVVVATPDHWHALQCLAALRAGLDVYCEKPLTHTFEEGQLLYREVAKQKAIFQTGSQQRSTANFHQAVELLHNGVLGKVRQVEVGLPAGHKEPIGDTTIQEPPANLDYESWCGPSELLPYAPTYHHRNWRWRLAYGGGQLMDWIGHHNDIAHWGLKLDKTGPTEVEAVNWTWPESKAVYDAPVDFDVVSRYADGTLIRISTRNEGGTRWIGDNGWIHVNRGKLDASNKGWLKPGFKAGPHTAYNSPDHTRNFVDGIKTRTECICPAETGHRSVTPGHLGHVSAKIGRKIKWDPKNERVIGDPDAEKRLKADYRYPWNLA
ncbi:MAG: Gfo/Idh/MocA family oxidoreductase [Verrucomicrobiae bacterium]|jgi:predicted dehydrogenase|nr:Gfo/Idh/MocA family oxidoreductase [Verrucomicrobiae bacterium]